MKVFTCLMLWLSLWILSVMSEEETTKKVTRIAIIGGGIAGTSILHFLKNDSRTSDVEVLFFEKEKQFGGRMKKWEIDGIQIELGASLFAEENHLVSNLTKQFRMTPVHSTPVLGIWNGNDFAFTSSEWKMITLAKVLWRYQLDPIYVELMASTEKEKFLSIYKLLEKKTYARTRDLLLESKLGGDFSKSFQNFLLEKGIARNYVDELAAAMTRINYSQSPNINFLAGLVCVIGSTGKVFSLKEGFSTLASKIVEHYKPKLFMETSVSSIEKEIESYLLKFGENTEKVDIVIIAAPLETAGISLTKLPINSKNLLVPPQACHGVIVTGDLNPDYFGSSELPKLILTANNESLPFYSIDYRGIGNKGNKVYKVKGPKEFTEELLNQLFAKRHESHRFLFPNAYPNNSPENVADIPFELLPNLFYINSMETPVSTMETQAIASRNIANILLQRLGGN